MNAGLCAQNLFLPRRLLHVLTILPEPPVHGFQAKIVLFQLPLEPRFLGDIRAGDLVNDFPVHLHPHALKAPRLAVFQRDDGLRFNRFPESVRVEQRLSRDLMAHLVHLEILQAEPAVLPGEAQGAGQMIAAFLDGNWRKLPPASVPQYKRYEKAERG